MIQIELLQKLLKLDEDELKNLDGEKLKVLFGCVQYASRIINREINTREEILK